jgi:predicted ATPase
MTEVIHQINNEHQPYGAIPTGFKFSLFKGYSVLMGKNNAGKSTLLQFVFKRLLEGALNSVSGKNSICLIPQDRQYVQNRTVPQASLQEYNETLYGQCQSAPRPSEGLRSPNSDQLYSLLLHRDDFLGQMAELNKFLTRLGFDHLILRDKQMAKLSDVDIHLHGSGIRCVLPVLAALTSKSINVILIDEPELSLEARAQKVLKVLLHEAAQQGKTILTATQSHLFFEK